MKATDILKSEHDVIKILLADLDAVCKKIGREEQVDPDHLDQILDFIRNFADAFHHAKEEDLLFSLMEEAGVPDEKDLVGELLAEHTLGRAFVMSLADEVELIREGKRAAATDFVDFAQSYILLLAHHICKEDNILCPMVDRHLTSQQQQRLQDEFEKVEREKFATGTRQKYAQIVESLKDTYGASPEILEMCK